MNPDEEKEKVIGTLMYLAQQIANGKTYNWEIEHAQDVDSFIGDDGTDYSFVSGERLEFSITIHDPDINPIWQESIESPKLNQ